MGAPLASVPNAGPVQSFGARRCVHSGTSAANGNPRPGAALVFFLGDPRLPALLCGTPRKSQGGGRTPSSAPGFRSIASGDNHGRRQRQARRTPRRSVRSAPERLIQSSLCAEDRRTDPPAKTRPPRPRGRRSRRIGMQLDRVRSDALRGLFGRGATGPARSWCPSTDSTATRRRSRRRARS